MGARDKLQFRSSVERKKYFVAIALCSAEWGTRKWTSTAKCISLFIICFQRENYSHKEKGNTVFVVQLTV